MDYTIALLCAVFEVSRTSYYNFARGRSYNLEKKYSRPRHEIRMEFLRNMKRYGSRRIQASLALRQIKLGRRTVSRLMKEEGLIAIQPRSFIPRTTDSKHGKRVCENLLLGMQKPSVPNAVWVSDITYIPLKGGKWAYLSAWQDLYTREIVGWAVAEHMREDLVREPLEKALLKKNAPKAMIIHSDRGGQYLSANLKKVVKTFELQQSMSRADDPYDNATAESLWSRIKAELEMPKGGYDNIEELHKVLFEYIEGYYNRQRLHSALNYQSPKTFIENYYKKVA